MEQLVTITVSIFGMSDWIYQEGTMSNLAWNTEPKLEHLIFSKFGSYTTASIDTVQERIVFMQNLI